MSRRRSCGRCPHCGRTVWLESLCQRLRTVDGIPVHARCYRRLSDRRIHHTTTPTAVLPDVLQEHR
jgi:hypothetical protein